MISPNRDMSYQLPTRGLGTNTFYVPNSILASVSHSYIISPSVLAADLSRLGEQLKVLEDAGVTHLHIDIMDGHFVPNISFGPSMVETCKRVTDMTLDVHLMISEPDRYISDFVSAGADGLTVHAEVTPHLHRTLETIRNQGVQAGLAFNPLSTLSILPEALPYLNLVLIMTVNPGFGGQSFIPASLKRIKTAKALIDEINPACHLQVDGGLDNTTIPQAAAAGANLIVVGSALFGQKDLSTAFRQLQQSVPGF
jgi:ribulose-phosphate 3-epimerase